MIILFCLTPDAGFTRQGRASEWEKPLGLSAHFSSSTFSLPERPKPAPLLFYSV